MGKECINITEVREIISGRMDSLQLHPFRTKPLATEAGNWAILGVDLGTNSCQDCDHFCAAKVLRGKGVGLKCEAWQSPSKLAAPLLRGVDFTTSAKKIREVIARNIETTPKVLYKCPMHKKG